MKKTNKKAAAPTNDVFAQADALSTKSAKIRFLDSQGVSRSAIAKHLNIKYQHVRNVLVTLLKKDIKA